MAKRNPEEVFTPKTIVSREMFERRNEEDLDGVPGLQDSLRDALRERGGQVLLYGDTGVGKSSLLTYAAADEKLGHVLVECNSDMDYDRILEFAIKEVVDVKELTRTRRVSGSMTGGVEGHPLPWIAKLTGSLRGEAGKETVFEVVEQDALSVLTEAMAKSKKSLIVLDNFQNVPKEARERVAQGMESLSDRAGRHPDELDFKFVVIGIASDAPSLLGSSRSYGRRTTEIGVPRMPDEEIAEILRRGFKILKLSVNEEEIKRMVFYSDGFPYFAHLLGLQTARAARRDSASAINESMIKQALIRASKAVSASYPERVRFAHEAGGEVQPRKRILRLLANSNARSWLSADVVEMWAKAHGKAANYSFLHTALSQLSQEKYGSILIRSGIPRRYKFEFSDPHLRPYLRIIDSSV